MLFEIEDTRKSNTTLFNVDEGFIKGNMFTNLYDKYKHYEPKKLLPTTEKDLLLYNITFAFIRNLHANSMWKKF